MTKRDGSVGRPTDRGTPAPGHGALRPRGLDQGAIHGTHQGLRLTAANTGRTHDRKRPIMPERQKILASRGPSTHVPVIHASLRPRPRHVDGRNKSGHDGLRRSEYFAYPVNLPADLNRTAVAWHRPSTALPRPTRTWMRGTNPRMTALAGSAPSETRSRVKFDRRTSNRSDDGKSAPACNPAAGWHEPTRPIRPTRPNFSAPSP